MGINYKPGDLCDLDILYSNHAPSEVSFKCSLPLSKRSVSEASHHVRSGQFSDSYSRRCHLISRVGGRVAADRRGS